MISYMEGSSVERDGVQALGRRRARIDQEELELITMLVRIMGCNGDNGGSMAIIVVVFFEVPPKVSLF